MDNHYLKRIVEKPRNACYINAGIYVLEPDVLELVPDVHFHMTDLFERLTAQGRKVCCFPIREFWMDIGQKDDYERAQREYDENFK
jgi:NDP-sugar pyrophosphorylase family protein